MTMQFDEAILINSSRRIERGAVYPFVDFRHSRDDSSFSKPAGRAARQLTSAGLSFGLLSEYPAIPRASMGFPADWKNCAIWKGT